MVLAAEVSVVAAAVVKTVSVVDGNSTGGIDGVAGHGKVFAAYPVSSCRSCMHLLSLG